ncbi:DEAD/DEAH box helicase [Desulfovibrio sp. OttesenSCG-928-F07]|nr:DEAD/DEAH box helicase [Desulfovibrio sp. OttesenSCG-928-F07]
MTTPAFSDLALSKELLKAVADLGFEEPSPIQALAIPCLLEGRDMVGQAQTGTGKTAAFGLPLLNKLNLRSNKTMALVLCPTRELAMQVSEEISNLANHMRGVSILPVYGGQPYERQIRALSRGVHIVVGTPGRVIDHLERKTLSLANLDTLVLDEADEMLDMGFREDIELVLSRAPEGCQKVCFSATMPRQVLDLAKSYMVEPEFIKITQKEITVPSIEQSYFEVRQHQKADALCLVLDSQEIHKGIIFCSTKRGVDELATLLTSRGYQADALHGNLAQTQRDRVMNRFRNGSIELLIATDVAARGLDVDDVDLVINFDIPIDVESYVHRIGRTGRAGRSGRALTFVTPRENYKLRDITRYTKANIQKAQLPSRREVNELKVGKLLDDIRAQIENMREADRDSKKIDRHELLLSSLVDDNTTPMQLAAALLKMFMEKDQSFNGPEIDPIPERNQREKGRYGERDGRFSDNFGDRGGRFADNHGDRGARFSDRGKPGFKGAKARGPQPKGRQFRNMERLFINVGSKFNISPRDIVGAITGETGLPGRIIGEIEIHDRFSFVEVPVEHAPQIMEAMNKTQLRGAKIAVDIAKPLK